MTEPMHKEHTRSQTPAKRTSLLRSKRSRTPAPPPETPEETENIDPDALRRGDVPMDMVDHLGELRSRLITVIVALALSVGGCFMLSDYILAYISKPFTATGLKLHVFAVTEGFLIRVKTALITGIIAALPIIVHQLWRYIMPAVDVRDRRFARFSIAAALALFFAGTAFTLVAVLPASIRFLVSLTPTGMQNLQNASDYISFVLMFCAGIGALFEFPLVIMILARIGIITPQFLASRRRAAIVLIFVGAAIFTPPDILSQVIIALPLVLLYELAIIIARFVIMRKKKRELQRA